MTYEAILDEMQRMVRDEYPNLDQREGSMIFNALAPCAFEIAQNYWNLDNVLRESFVETASREYKLIGCADRGIDINQFNAHAGVFRGEFDQEIEIGSRWNLELYNYVVEEELTSENEYHWYALSCETLGTAPNLARGTLTPIDTAPSNLNYAELTEVLIEGENEKSDEEINKVYRDFIKNIASDGNVNQYLKWCNEYDGIGNAKVFPLWNGVNTVKVSILSSTNNVASESLIESFQHYLDPDSTGMGDGVAPIGAVVTVTTATEKPINVSATVVMKNGYSDKSVIDNTLEEYFNSIAYEKSSVPYMNVGAVILSADGVDSISNLKINNGINDISLGIEEIPVLGSTTWN